MFTSETAVDQKMNFEFEFSKAAGAIEAKVIRARKYVTRGRIYTSEYNLAASRLEWFLNDLLFYSTTYNVYFDDLLNQLSKTINVGIGLKWIDENWYEVNATIEELEKVMNTSHKDFDRACWTAYFSKGVS